MCLCLGSIILAIVAYDGVKAREEFIARFARQILDTMRPLGTPSC
jgi:hypothetical protein